MKLTDLNEEEVLKQAQLDFKEEYVECGTTDLFLKDIETGKIEIDGIDHPLYVSTNYAYENHIVNNNKTRYKVKLTTILIKKDRYATTYDSRGKYYIAYEEEGIHFVLYEEFQVFLKPLLHVLKEE